MSSDIKKTKGESESTDSKYNAPALRKGLQIIETLAAYPTGLSLTEVAKRLDYTVNEIFRMVITLQELGYIQIGEDENYRLTLKLFDIAHRSQPVHSIVATALPLMQELAHRSLQSCHLAVYYAGRSMIVAQVDSPERWTFSVKVGAIVDLLETASGNVMLAFASDSARSRMLKEHTEYTGTKVTGVQALGRRWQQIREQGFWSAKSQQTVGVTNLAYPIFMRGAEVPAVLIVPFLERAVPRDEPGYDQVMAQLSTTASTVSRLMGLPAGD